MTYIKVIGDEEGVAVGSPSQNNQQKETEVRLNFYFTLIFLQGKGLNLLLSAICSITVYLNIGMS